MKWQIQKTPLISINFFSTITEPSYIFFKFWILMELFISQCPVLGLNAYTSHCHILGKKFHFSCIWFANFCKQEFTRTFMWIHIVENWRKSYSSCSVKLKCIFFCDYNCILFSWQININDKLLWTRKEIQIKMVWSMECMSNFSTEELFVDYSIV